MPIYSSPNAAIGLKSPLSATINSPSLDVVLNYNPSPKNWGDLFLEFAIFVHDSADNLMTTTATGFPNRKSGLSRLIYTGWLQHLVQKDTSGLWGYRPGIVVTGRDTLFAALNNQLTSKPESELFMLIGLYHFVIWLLSNRGIPGLLTPIVTNYIKSKLIGYTYYDPNPDYHIEWNGSAVFPSTFANAFDPKNSLLKFALELQKIRSCLIFKKGGVGLPAFAAASVVQKRAIKHAICSFIREARRLLEEVVHDEVLSVLKKIRPVVLENHYGRMKIMAAGLGEDTYGFFGIRSFGILFFDYELRDVPSETDFADPATSPGVDAIDYLGVSNERTWEGKSISSVFVSHVGIDKTFQPEYNANSGQTARRNELIPHIELERSDPSGSEDAVLYAADHEGYSFSTDASASLYESTTGKIPLTESQSVKLKLVTNKSVATGGALATGILIPSTLTQEELAFFIFPNTIDRTTTSASASTSWLLEDNKFWKDLPTINQEVFRPAGSVDPALDAVIAELVFGPDFTVSAKLRGEGVGSLLDAAETPAGGPTVRRSSNQQDRPVPNAGSNNNLLRYAHGSMVYSANAISGNLEFDVVAFASPLRCTWETKLLNHPLMWTEVGQWLELDHNRTWYNGALSAFRAFGFFKAMIEAVKNRIDELSVQGSDLNSAAPQIRNKLDDYLNDSARVQIKTQSGVVVKKRLAAGPVELVVDQVLFNLFVPP